MKTWTAAIALFAASTMLVGSALAQATSPGDQSKDKAKGGSSMPSSSPAASGSSSTDSTKSDSSATKSDAGKTDMKASDATKSDTKSDTMKSAKHGKGKGDMARAGGNTEQVRAAQQALKDKGHDPGEIDGKMGPKTQAALKDYQSKEGLKATGRLDAETMTKLGIEAKTGAAAGATSSPSASPKTDVKADTKADSKADAKAGAPSSDASASPKTGADSSSSTGAAAPQPGATDTKADEKKTEEKK